MSCALRLTLTLSAFWLQFFPSCFFVFTNYSGMQEGAEGKRRSGIHLHSYWFVLLLLSLFFFFRNREQDGISRGQKETEQKSFKQQNPWVSVPQGSVRLPCGCNVFVCPSPLITIMSLERSVMAEVVCVHECLQRCWWVKCMSGR